MYLKPGKSSEKNGKLYSQEASKIWTTRVKYTIKDTRIRSMTVYDGNFTSVKRMQVLLFNI